MSNLKENMVSDENKLSAYIPEINWKEFFCGWSAGFINVSILHPVNKLMFRQMLHGVTATKALTQLRHEGIFFLYRGILPPLCQKTLTFSLMFGVYEEARRRLEERNINEYATKTLAGAISGFSEYTLLPLERIQSLLCATKYHDKLKNTGHAVIIIMRDYGFTEFFRGTIPFLLRIAPTNALFFLGKDEIHKRIPRDESHLIKVFYDFTGGAVLGSFLSCLFYPVTVIKIAMQTKLGGKFESTWLVFSRIYNERGRKIRYLYYGVPMNVTRAFLSWGLMNVAYELVKLLIF